MRLAFRPIVLVLLGVLTACAPTLPPGGIAALDGVYEGEMARSAGPPQNCPGTFKIRLTVARGEVRGEVFDPGQPDVPTARFAAFVEADGRIVNAVRLGAHTFGLRGRFGATNFVANADTQTCGLSVNATRRP
jgi:hypothetical protein